MNTALISAPEPGAFGLPGWRLQTRGTRHPRPALVGRTHELMPTSPCALFWVYSSSAQAGAARGFRGRRRGHDDAQRIPRWRPRNNNKHSFPYEPLVVLAPERDDGLGILLLELERRHSFFLHQRTGIDHHRSGPRPGKRLRAIPRACWSSVRRCVWALPLAVQSSKCDPRKGSSQ